MLVTYKRTLFSLLMSRSIAFPTNCLRGLFHLPPRAKVTDSWSLTGLLFLLTPQFEPLECATFHRLTQKALCIILLASGRQIGEITHLTRNYEEIVSPTSISLVWAPDFVPKTTCLHFGHVVLK